MYFLSRSPAQVLTPRFMYVYFSHLCSYRRSPEEQVEIRQYFLKKAEEKRLAAEAKKLEKQIAKQ